MQIPYLGTYICNIFQFDQMSRAFIADMKSTKFYWKSILFYALFMLKLNTQIQLSPHIESYPIFLEQIKSPDKT